MVETEPPGVEVLVGGTPAGRTPLRLRTVRAGTHSVTLRHPDYETAGLDGQAFADGRVLRIERTMVRATGAVTVIVEPAHAWIERDGARLAEGTPVTLEGLPAGTVELTLGADEFRAVRVAAEVPRDGVGMLERTLEPIPHGTLTLDLDPPDAAVTLPDIVPAYRPGMRLPEGPHRVVVAHRDHRDATLTVEVSGDTRRRVELALGPQPFTVATTPADAVVRFVNVDEAYRDGIPLDPGEYRIRVGAPEYETLEEAVSHGGAPTVHRVTLARSPQPFTVAVTPGDAAVGFVGISEDYVPGMRLPPGEYRVRVGAEGFETVEERVRHGTDPTRVEVALRRSVPGPGGTFADALASGGNGPEMVVIPAGRFEMGCDVEDCDDDEKPVHEVRIGEDFALGRYEVTVGEFRGFVEASGYRTEAERDVGTGCFTQEIMDRNSWGWTPGRSWRNLEYAVEEGQPVVCVSWNDARAYAAWLGSETGASYRLPSESEWEYAVRAGTRTRYHFGDAEERLCDYGNVAARTKLPNGRTWPNRAECEDGAVYPTAAGSYRPNAFGLHDMHGNVWEWVEDCWNGSYMGARTDGSAWLRGDCSARVLRGGSWDNNPGDLRAAYRSRIAPVDRYGSVGFRVARTLTP